MNEFQSILSERSQIQKYVLYESTYLKLMSSDN